MIRNKIIAVSCFAIALAGCSRCSKDAQDIEKAKEMLQNVPQATQSIQQQMDANKALKDARVKRGDTLAINYKDLQKYLPTSLDGYKAEPAKGESANFGGFSYSTATIKFVKGSENVQVDIGDYNAVGELFSSLTLWSAGMSVENDQGYQKTFKPDLPNSVGFEEWNKSTKTAKITIGIAGRFLLVINCENQANTDLPKKIAAMMNLKDLANK